MKRLATIVLIVLTLFHAVIIMAQDQPVEIPTEFLTATPTATLFLLPTETPVGDWVDAVSATGAYVRAGPGLRFPVVTSLPNGTIVEPVGRDQEKGWIMLRIGDGFGWLLRPLVRWVTDLDSLPILYIGALTPSPTFTSSPTFTPTATASHTATPTNTATLTPPPTFTPTETASPTTTFTVFPSNTPLPTWTLTPSPSATFTNTAVPTLTLLPTETFTPFPTDTETAVPTALPTDTFTPLPTDTSTAVPTEEPPTATNTFVPTDTATVTPEPTTEVPLATALLLATAAPTQTFTIVPPDTLTFTPFPTETQTATPRPSDTATLSPSPTDAPVVLLVPTEPPVPTATSIPTETRVSPASETPTTLPSVAPTQTFTPIPSETATVQPSPTVQVEPIIVAAEPTVTPPTSVTPENPQTDESALIEENTGALSIPGEAVVASVILLVVAGYVVSYWRGATAVDRYANGFAVDECPVCKHGTLHVETHVGRVLGVPQPRSVVTCDNCRSVLREVGRRRWRYAVDRSANAMLFGQFNGRIIDEEKLINLTVWNQTLDKPPTFEEETS